MPHAGSIVWSLLLMLLLLTFENANCASPTTVKVFLVNPAPLQPYGKWGTPCKNVSKDSCKAGFARQAAVIRNAEKGANATIKAASLLAISGLVSAHPLWLELNYILYTSINFDFLFMSDPDAFAEAKRIGHALEVIRKYSDLGFPTVSSNLIVDSKEWRGYIKYQYISSPLPGVKLAIMIVWPEGYWFPTLSVSATVNAAKYLRLVEGVTHVLVHVFHQVSSAESQRYLENGFIDVVTYAGTEPSSKAREPVTKVFNNYQNKQFTIQTAALFHSVDAISLQFDGTVLTGVTTDALPTVVYPEELKDSYYYEQSDKIQSLITESSKTDHPFCESVTAMPHGSKWIEDVKSAPCWQQECELGTLFAKALSIPREVDLSFGNGGALREGWEAGPLRGSGLSRAFPFKDTICYFNASGAEINRILENAVMYVGSDGEFNYTAEIPGRFLQVNGIRYSFNPSLERGSRITQILYQNEPNVWSDINMQRQYRVATSNFLCRGGDDYDFQPHNDVFEHTQTDIFGTVLSHLRESSPYTPTLKGSITVDFNGEHKKYAKTALDCSDEEMWVKEWMICSPCIDGFYHPIPGEDKCIPRPPPPSAPVSPVAFALPPTVALVLIAALTMYMLMQRQKNRIHRMVRYAPTKSPIAIVFTDIQSSSKLWGQFPEEMTEALDLHHRVFRELIDKHRGYEVKTIGDAFMIAFACPLDAVEFSTELQVALYDVDWPLALESHEACASVPRLFNGIRVRSGVHYGDCVVKPTPQGGYDYEGNVINTCARVSDAGAGGQALITEAVYDIIDCHLADMSFNVNCKYLGAFEFKGIAEPVACIQVLPERFSGRQFSALRNCTPYTEVAPADETKDTVSDNSSKLGSMASMQERGEVIESMQVLRRHFGAEGLSIVEASEMLLVPLRENCVSDFKIVACFFKTLLQSNDLTVNPRIRDTESVHAQLTATEGVHCVRWSVFSKVLSRLPGTAVIAMARHVECLRDAKVAW